MTDSPSTDGWSGRRRQAPSSLPGQGDVAATAPGADDANTLALPECNDCAVSKLFELLEESSTRSGGELSWTTADLSRDPLELNFIGLRRHDSITNRFDDEMFVLYVAPHLDDAHEVEDVEYLEPLINVEAVNAFLAEDGVWDDLKVKGDQLPGDPNFGPSGKQMCPVHLGWRVLRFAITTEPGTEPKDEAAHGVPVGKDELALAQRRAVVFPGVYRDTHRMFIHKWGGPGGYVALSQSGALDIRRHFTAEYLLGKLEARAEADPKARRRDRDKPRWQVAYNKQLAKRRAKRRNAAAPDLETWMRNHLAGVLNGAMSLVNTAHSARTRVREVLTGDIGGAARTASGLQPAYTFTESPPGSWTLSVTAIEALHGSERWSLASSDVVAVIDHDVSGINIHQSSSGAGRLSKQVNTWSEGCQVFSKNDDHARFRRLYALSKRARCAPRRRGTCSSAAGPLTLDDMIWFLWAKPAQKQKYGPGGEEEMTASTWLEQQLAAGFYQRKDAGEATDATAGLLFERAKNLKTRAPGAAAKESLVKGWKIAPAAVRRHKRRIATAVDDKLLAPLPAGLRSRLEVPAKRKKIISSLTSMIKKAIKSGVDRDSGLRATYDATLVTERAVRARGAKRRAKKSGDVKAERTAAELRVTEALLTKLEQKLAELAASVNDADDEAAWSKAEVEQELEERRQRWVSQGLERCDVFKECPRRFSYTLAEIPLDGLQELDERTSFNLHTPSE